MATEPLPCLISPGLEHHLAHDDPQWWGQLQDLRSGTVLSPPPESPSGRWLKEFRIKPEYQHAPRVLAMLGIPGLCIAQPSILEGHLVKAALIEYGQEHGHTCVGQKEEWQGLKLGKWVSDKRRAYNHARSQDKTLPDWRFFTEALRRWRWAGIPGVGSAAMQELIIASDDTEEHRWWDMWAKSFRWRLQNPAFCLLTEHQITTSAGKDVWQWLEPLCNNPAAHIKTWPKEDMHHMRCVAMALLNIAPPANTRLEWFPAGSLGQRLRIERRLMAFQRALDKATEAAVKA